MLKRPLIFVFATSAAFVTWPVALFVLNADVHLKRANATTSIAAQPFKAAHAANQTTTRILALDQAKHLAFWTSILKNKKRACDVVVRTVYQGGTESGVDNWSIGCRDGHKYSISINPDAQDSVCTRNTFAESAE